jgi:hypothetical protein
MDIIDEAAYVGEASCLAHGEYGVDGSRTCSVETMLQVFNVDDVTRRNDGQSAVHLCAVQCDWQRVEQLVAVGANLALHDVRGNTPLHVVVEEPAMKESFLQVSHIQLMTSEVWATVTDRNSSADIWCINGSQV